MFVFVEGE